MFEKISIAPARKMRYVQQTFDFLIERRSCSSPWWGWPLATTVERLKENGYVFSSIDWPLLRDVVHWRDGLIVEVNDRCVDQAPLTCGRIAKRSDE